VRHRNHRQRLSRPAGPRLALLRNLELAIIEHGRIRTTEVKAKAVRPLVERLVTLGKKGTQHHRRQAFAQLQKKGAVTKLFEEIAPKMADRPGGYTRIILDGQRKGDGAWMAVIEFVTHGEEAVASEGSEVAAANS
jgi:large subunit ribosomal protein L17